MKGEGGREEGWREREREVEREVEGGGGVERVGERNGGRGR